jgi:hypothetical protein
MNNHPELEIRMMEQRRRDLLRQARLNHLMTEARRDEPGIQQRLMLMVSDLMIAGGKRLQQRATAAKVWREPSVEIGKW